MIQGQQIALWIVVVAVGETCVAVVMIMMAMVIIPCRRMSGLLCLNL